MKIDLTCPCEVWRAEETKNAPGYELTLYNLSGRMISSCEVMLLFPGASQRIVRRAHDLHVPGGKTFRISVEGDARTRGMQYELTIEKVWFEDGVVWRRDKKPLTEYRSNTLTDAAALSRLRALAGETAIGYPSDQGHVWVCVCGRANGADEESCIRCHRTKELVFDRFSREKVEAEMNRVREENLARNQAAIAHNNQLLEERGGEKQQKRSRIRRIAVGCVSVAAAGALITAGVIFIPPYLRYRSATEQMNGAHWAQAIEAFDQMGDYRDAREQADYCRFEQAREQMNSGSEKLLKQAENAFSALGDYPEAEALKTESIYRRAVLVFDEGRYSEANGIFTNLGDYAESATYRKKCDYQSACTLLESGSYAESAKAFEALGDFEDSRERVKEATFLQGKAALTLGDYNSAIQIFTDLESYPGAEDMLKQAWATKGDALAETDPLTAGQAYFAAGDYPGAHEKGCAAIYKPAMAEMAAGHYDAAAELLLQLGEWEDAHDRYYECIFIQADQRLRAKDYDGALEMLSLLPADYESVGELTRRCKYGQAAQMVEAGDLTQAAALFDTLEDFMDSETQAKQCRYTLAGLVRDEGKKDEALAIYQQLGDYENSAEEAKRLTYLIAEDMLGEGETDGAEALFDTLGDYEDAAVRADQIRYDRACTAFDEGRYDDAELIFASLGSFEDSAEKVPACRYAKADALQQQGSLDEALTLFTELGEYNDSADRARGVMYAQAELLEMSGELEQSGELFAKLGTYSDSQERAQKIVYTRAENALTDGNTDDAITLFESLDNYRDSHDRALAIRLDIAWAAYENGNMDSAVSQLKKLGKDGKDMLNRLYMTEAAHLEGEDALDEARAMYANASTLDAKNEINRIDHLKADKLAEEGNYADALAIYQALGNWGDSKDRVSHMYYLMGEAAEKAGDLLQATGYYSQAGDWLDSRERVASCQSVYRQPRDDAKQMMEEGNWQGALDMLSAMDLTALPEEFAEMAAYADECVYQLAAQAAEAGDHAKAAAMLDERVLAVKADEKAKALWLNSCYQVADAALLSGDEQAALPYLLRLHGHEQAHTLLNRTFLRLLASWQSEDGETWCFNADGSCTLGDQAYTWELDGYNVILTQNDDSAVGLKIAMVNDDQLTVRDVRGAAEKTVRLTWAGYPELPELKTE